MIKHPYPKEALKYHCPLCGAKPGKPCIRIKTNALSGSNNQLRMCHNVRIALIETWEAAYHKPVEQ